MRLENKQLYDTMPLNDERLTGKDTKLSAMMDPPNPGVYERGIVPAIYPAIKKFSFQAGKPDRMFLGKHDAWFYQLHGSTNIWQMMQSDLENLINSLDKKFLLEDRYRGLLGFKYWRKHYRIGSVSNFCPTAIDSIFDQINIEEPSKDIDNLK
jgi:hypothetical protein